MTDAPIEEIGPSHKTAFNHKGPRLGDPIFAGISRIFGLALIGMLFAILVVLVHAAWPSIEQFGFAFIPSTTWNPVTNEFGAWPAIVGTLVSSCVAMLFAIPISFGIAVFITEIAPPSIGSALGRLIELMAGIPSIIFGMWGLLVFAPFLARHVQPPIIEAFAGVPLLGTIFGPPPIGIGVFTAGIILAIMTIPLITAVMRDVILSVPTVMREAAYGIGCTRFEVVRLVLVPAGRIGLVGAVILGLGRALGETMAVTFVIGNAHNISASLFMPGTTISATIANEFTEATGTLYPAALMELGIILFVITIIVLALSRLMLRATTL
ncbi:MAG: phosphate ABC transporter permease subunit PstC [Pseudomonadota bacterium]